ncbi:MAG: hypothetical protein LCH54_12770 [Bacteroidetes bacterium]|nr:hypothetical protein [Bacteroidota bacterium]
MVSESLSGLELVFLAFAITGGVIVLVKLVIQFIAGADSDIGTDTIDHPSDSDLGFKMLSLQGIGAFFMMFGLVGLAMYRESQMGVILSVLMAFVAGLFSVWMIAKLFKFANKLQSDGTVGIEKMKGSPATVYLKIPAKGIGTVTVHYNGRGREYDAREKSGKAIETGKDVVVLEISGKTLIVEAKD